MVMPEAKKTMRKRFCPLPATSGPKRWNTWKFTAQTLSRSTRRTELKNSTNVQALLHQRNSRISCPRLLRGSTGPTILLFKLFQTAASRTGIPIVIWSLEEGKKDPNDKHYEIRNVWYRGTFAPKYEDGFARAKVDHPGVVLVLRKNHYKAALPPKENKSTPRPSMRETANIRQPIWIHRWYWRQPATPHTTEQKKVCRNY